MILQEFYFKKKSSNYLDLLGTEKRVFANSSGVARMDLFSLVMSWTTGLPFGFLNFDFLLMTFFSNFNYLEVSIPVIWLFPLINT